MRYCSSSLFSSSVDQIKGSSCISCSWACYWCIEHGLLLSILSSSFLVSSFVVSIAHWSGGHLGVQFFGHLSLSRGSALSLLFFLYLGSFVCKVEGSATSISIGQTDVRGHKVIIGAVIPPVGDWRGRFAHSPTCDPASLSAVIEYINFFHSVVFDCIGDYSMNLLLYIYCF